VTTQDETPLQLRDENAFEVGYVSDFYALLRAIDEAFPKEAVLYVEGTSIAPEISAFLRAHEATERRAVAPNTWFPKPSVFHLPLANLENFVR